MKMVQRVKVHLFGKDYGTIISALNFKRRHRPLKKALCPTFTSPDCFAGSLALG